MPQEISLNVENKKGEGKVLETKVGKTEWKDESWDGKGTEDGREW